MKKFIKSLKLVFYFAVFYNTVVFADVPQILAFQGRITDNSGVPITETNGNFSFQFNGGTSIPIRTNVYHGLYSVNIDVSALGLDFDNQISVNVSYDGVDLGTTNLTASPYALSIKDGAITTAKLAPDVQIPSAVWSSSSALAYGVIGDTITTDNIQDGAITTAKIADSSINGDKIISNLGGTAYQIYVASAAFAEAVGADLAEIYFSPEALEPGDICIISQTNDDNIEKSKIANDTRVAGVISTKPGLLINSKEKGYKLALVGKVPVKVTNEGGSIRRGDMLTVSSTPGSAMKTSNPKPGTIIGKALQNFDGIQGTILVLVNLQ
jgi:hypothetical protein